MSRHRLCPRDRAAFGELPHDLYVVPVPWPRFGPPVKHDVESWRVIDDWPARVPVESHPRPGPGRRRPCPGAGRKRRPAGDHARHDPEIRHNRPRAHPGSAAAAIAANTSAALAQRVEVADKEVRIMGSKSDLLRTLAASSGVKPATPGVRSSVPSWRKGWDSNPRWTCAHGGFQDRCLKPLGHLSFERRRLRPAIAARRRPGSTPVPLRRPSPVTARRERTQDAGSRAQARPDGRVTAARWPPAGRRRGTARRFQHPTGSRRDSPRARPAIGARPR